MRFLLKVTIPNDPGNRLIKDGKFSKKLQEILDNLKPEAAYFLEQRGRRTGIFIVNMSEVSQMAMIAEPFFLAFDAKVEFHPVMLPEDLAKADLVAVGKKWG